MRFRSRFWVLGALGVVAVVLLVAGGIAVAASSHHYRVFRGKRSALTAAQIRRLSAGAKKRTIIIFKNQLTNLPARRGTAKRAGQRSRRISGGRPSRARARKRQPCAQLPDHQRDLGDDHQRRGAAPAGEPRRAGGGPRRVPALRVAGQRPRPRASGTRRAARARASPALQASRSARPIRHSRSSSPRRGP